MIFKAITKSEFNWLSLVFLILLGALWGANPSFSKALALAGLSPFSVVFWQTLGAGILLLIICLIKGVKLKVDVKHLIYFSFMGVVGIDVSYITLVYTAEKLSAGYVSILILFSPLLTYALALLLRMEPLIKVRALGIAVGLAGAAILVLPAGSIPSEDLRPIAILAFITPLGYAAGNVFADIARPKDSDNVALAMGTMFAAACGALVGCLIDNSFHQVWLEFGYADVLLILFILSTSVAFIIFYTIIKMAGAVYLGQVGYLVTVFGVCWGILFFSEKPSIWLWLAAFLVAGGVALVNFGGKQKPGRPDENVR